MITEPGSKVTGLRFETRYYISNGCSMTLGALGPVLLQAAACARISSCRRRRQQPQRHGGALVAEGGRQRGGRGGAGGARSYRLEAVLPLPLLLLPSFERSKRERGGEGRELAHWLVRELARNKLSRAGEGGGNFTDAQIPEVVRRGADNIGLAARLIIKFVFTVTLLLCSAAGHDVFACSFARELA